MSNDENIKIGIRKFIFSEINNDSSTCKDNESLFENGLLTSLSVVQLFVYIYDKYRIKLDLENIQIEDFDTIDNIVKFIKKMSW